MSGALPLILAAAASGAPEPDIALNAITVAVPSLDGAHGLQVSYERWLPRPQISVSASVQLREAAVGDYTGIRAGVGGEVRWYFRQKSFLHAQPQGSMVGWWTGGRIDIAVDGTHDLMTDRWLGTNVEIGTSALVGYRFAPWRGLEITPSAGVTWHRDIDTSGRLPGWNRTGFAVGLSAGWMF